MLSQSHVQSHMTTWSFYSYEQLHAPHHYDLHTYSGDHDWFFYPPPSFCLPSPCICILQDFVQNSLCMRVAALIGSKRPLEFQKVWALMNSNKKQGQPYWHVSCVTPMPTSTHRLLKHLCQLRCLDVLPRPQKCRRQSEQS